MSARRRGNSAEPSLVPMADMLTNTVGIVVFISISTILATSGMVLVKHLPIEHSTAAAPLYFLCTQSQVYPVDTDTLLPTFSRPLGRPPSYRGADEWLARFNQREVEDAWVKLAGDGRSQESIVQGRLIKDLQLTVRVIPREQQGESVSEIGRQASRFRAVLSKYSPDRRFVLMLVTPDSLETFQEARRIAAQSKFASGWIPLNSQEPVRLSLTGRGALARPQ
jgi:hypothetical protein